MGHIDPGGVAVRIVLRPVRTAARCDRDNLLSQDVPGLRLSPQKKLHDFQGNRPAGLLGAMLARHDENTLLVIIRHIRIGADYARDIPPLNRLAEHLHADESPAACDRAIDRLNHVLVIRSSPSVTHQKDLPPADPARKQTHCIL